jgi:hypothetical protein
VRTTSLLFIALLLFGAAPALAAHHEAESSETKSGQASDESAPLQATFEPTPEPSGYTTDYYFAMTRGVSNSTLHKAFALPLFLLTVPVDIMLLPGAAIAGFF